MPHDRGPRCLLACLRGAARLHGCAAPLAAAHARSRPHCSLTRRPACVRPLSRPSRFLDGTSLHGTVPAAWCRAPFAPRFTRLCVQRVGAHLASHCLLTGIDALPGALLGAPSSTVVSPSARTPAPPTLLWLACRSLAGTSVDPVLPACARHSFPSLLPAGRRHAYRSQMPRRGVALAVLLALGAAAAAGAAGRVLLHRAARRGRRGGGAALRAERRGLLEDASATSSAQQSAGSSRRARVSRVLRDRFGVQSRAVPMQVVSALPARLAHKLVQGAPGAHGLREMELQPLESGSSLRHTAGLPRHAVEAWAAGGSVHAGAGAGGSGAPSARRWRLDTHSLELAPREIEVGRSARGAADRKGPPQPAGHRASGPAWWRDVAGCARPSAALGSPAAMPAGRGRCALIAPPLQLQSHRPCLPLSHCSLCWTRMASPWCWGRAPPPPCSWRACRASRWRSRWGLG